MIGPAAGGGTVIDEEVRRHVHVTTWLDMVGQLEKATSWGRRSSLWPFGFGLACCAIETMAVGSARYDLARFGAEVARASPRQADLIMVSGTVTKKMVPLIVRLFNQMAEPKYVLSMGACANGGGPFKEGYNVVSGIEEFLPVDVYIRGCPPTPQAFLHGLIELQRLIDGESYIRNWKFKRRPEIPVPLLGPDLVDVRQAAEIRMGAAGKARPSPAPKVAPAVRPAPNTGDAMVVDAAAWSATARSLRDEQGWDYLSNLTCSDYADCFEVVYHLHRTGPTGPRLTVKVRTDRARPEVPSVMPVWAGAELQEREVYDLMGVGFAGHPKLRRMFLWEGFSGHPLRKDWTEAYYEEARKSFASRWREGAYSSAESRSPWGRNVSYPEGFDATALSIPEPVEDPENIARRRLLVSIGPQHPSTHGVFQMRVLLEGERVVALEPVLGYLHRNHEKIGERNTYLMNMPYTDRLDYLTSMANNLAYAVAVERLCGMKVPERAEYIRVIMAELTRVMSHLMAIGFLLNEMGAMWTPAMYALEERELMLDLFEMASGSRMMCNYMRFSGVAADLPQEFMPLVSQLIHERLPRAVDEMDRFLTGSEILRARCQGVGVLSRERAINVSASGPVLRASGVAYDLRKAVPYSIYDRFEFDVPTFPGGDVYDRYRQRLAEIRQSLRILEQAVKQMPDSGPVIDKKQYLVRPPEGEIYSACENPKGELGFYLASDGGMSPYRYHVRSPSYINLNGLEGMCRGHLLADAVVILGSLDIVMGEVDR